MGQIVLAPLATRTGTITGDYTRTWTERGAHFLLNLSAVPGVDTVTVSISGLDALGNAYPLISSDAHVTTGLKELRIYPEAVAAANLALKDFLPDKWRWTVTHSGSGSFTYSLCMNTSD